MNSDYLSLMQCNITLAYDIRETCTSENIVLDECVHLVFSNGKLELENCVDLESMFQLSLQLFLLLKQ